jgi:hypothetical protein
VGPRAGLDAVANKKIPAPDANRTPVSQSIENNQYEGYLWGEPKTSSIRTNVYAPDGQEKNEMEERSLGSKTCEVMLKFPSDASYYYICTNKCREMTDSHRDTPVHPTSISFLWSLTNNLTCYKEDTNYIHLLLQHSPEMRNRDSSVV